MKGFLKFVFIFVSVLLLSALLAPVLYDFLPFKFERIFQRLVMIFALAAILIFVRVRRETLVRYGMDWRKESVPLFLTGFLTAIAVLLIYTGAEALAGNAHWGLRDYTWLKWIQKIMGCFATAIVIGPLEEFFFRGFVYNSLKDNLCRGNIGFGMILTSFFYSSLHFVSLRRPLIGPDPGFTDSLKLIAATARSFGDLHGVWPAAIGLFLFGMILNYAAVRSKSLYASIGLHAGCVFFVRTVGYFVPFLGRHKFLLGTNKVYDGVLGWVFLLIIGFLLSKFLKKVDAVPSLTPVP